MTLSGGGVVVRAIIQPPFCSPSTVSDDDDDNDNASERAKRDADDEANAGFFWSCEHEIRSLVLLRFQCSGHGRACTHAHAYTKTTHVQARAYPPSLLKLSLCRFIYTVHSRCTVSKHEHFPRALSLLLLSYFYMCNKPIYNCVYVNNFELELLPRG